MNTMITFPAPEPTLKLARPSAGKWAAALAEERRRLFEDHEALREREENLRRYEARLRALQDEIISGRGAPATDVVAVRLPSRAPFAEDSGLAAGWEKLHRARELLAAEEVHLREDRHVLREQEQVLKRREEEVAAREKHLHDCAAHAALAEGGAEPVAGEHTISSVSRLTRFPFDMARSVFGGKK
jgi:hypothetical protein